MLPVPLAQCMYAVYSHLHNPCPCVHYFRLQVVPLGTDPANQLVLELTPTPRWPDLMVAYFPPSK